MDEEIRNRIVVWLENRLIVAQPTTMPGIISSLYYYAVSDDDIDQLVMSLLEYMEERINNENQD